MTTSAWFTSRLTGFHQLRSALRQIATGKAVDAVVASTSIVAPSHAPESPDRIDVGQFVPPLAAIAIPELRKAVAFKGLYSRVALIAGVTPTHVSHVARGIRQSSRVVEAIITEVRRIERETAQPKADGQSSKTGEGNK